MPGFLSDLRKDQKSEVKDKGIEALMGKMKRKSLLEELAKEERLEEEILEEEILEEERLEEERLEEERLEEEMIKSVQDKKIKPMQGSWYWNPNDMTMDWSIKRPNGSPDRYMLTFKEEDFKKMLSNSRRIKFDTLDSEEDSLEDFDMDDSEEVAGFKPAILTGTN